MSATNILLRFVSTSEKNFYTVQKYDAPTKTPFATQYFGNQRAAREAAAKLSRECGLPLIVKIPSDPQNLLR